MKYVDVSEHQGVIDWAAMRGAIDGAILRAGYGRGNVDKQFHRNASECNRLKIPCGAYWFSYAYTEEMARLEAQQFLMAARQHEMELPLAWDYEDASSDNARKNGVTPTATLVRAMATAFCTALEAAGYWAMIYTNPSHINQFYGNLAGGRFDLWLAQWPKTVDVTKPPRACGIWQWGCSYPPGIAKSAGYDGKVDTNEAYRDYATFLRANGFNGLKPKAAPKPAEPPYAQAMAWAKANGLTDKDPADPVTVADVVQMFYALHGEEDDKKFSGLLEDD